MADKDYSKMPLLELMKAVTEGDEAAKAYHNELLKKQLADIEEFDRTHNVELFSQTLAPFYQRLLDIEKKYPLKDMLELKKKMDETIVVQREMTEYYKLHEEAIELITDTATDRLKNFCKALTVEDLEAGLNRKLTDDQKKEFQADRQNFFLNLDISECITVIEYINGKHRTRARAEQTEQIIGSLPKRMAIITAKDFQYATSLHQKGNAYLQQFKGTEDLRFKDGKLYFPGNLQPLSEMELQNLRTKEGITEIDLPLLRVFYNAILSDYQAHNALKDVVAIYVPDLAVFMGMKANLSKQEIQEKIVSKIQSFHNVTGVLKGWRNGKTSESYYQVLNFEWYNETTNTVAFSSPYMNLVIKTIYDITVKKDKAGKPKLKSNGEPFRLPAHSYLIDSEIIKERNKAAVENVVIIVALIEQAGDNTANIKAKTIIERNPQLQERLEASEHKAQFLKRVFTKTWELLRSRTKLTEAYEDIQLPDPKNPASIPTVKSLDSLVFSFPHKGKIQKPKMP